MTTSITNEYTSLQKYNLSHFIFERVMFVVCEKRMETRTDCYIDPAVLLSHLGWVAQLWVTEGRKALSLQAGSSVWHPVSN